MAINKNSWHFRAWQFVQPDDKRDVVPTYCTYWTDIFIGIPFCSVIFLLMSPMIPIIWLSEKVEAKFSKRIMCPFGKVKFIESGEPSEGGAE